MDPTVVWILSGIGTAITGAVVWLAKAIRDSLLKQPPGSEAKGGLVWRIGESHIDSIEHSKAATNALVAVATSQATSLEKLTDGQVSAVEHLKNLLASSKNIEGQLAIVQETQLAIVGHLDPTDTLRQTIERQARITTKAIANHREKHGDSGIIRPEDRP